MYDSAQTNLRIEALRPLLFIGSDLDPAQLERMAKTMTPFAKPPGTTLFAQGEKPAAMYYITEGQVSFFRRPSSGRMKASAVALQKQFEMEERSNALEESKKLLSADDEPVVEQRRATSDAERHNAFLELSALMSIGDAAAAAVAAFVAAAAV